MTFTQAPSFQVKLVNALVREAVLRRRGNKVAETGDILQQTLGRTRDGLNELEQIR